MVVVFCGVGGVVVVVLGGVGGDVVVVFGWVGGVVEVVFSRLGGVVLVALGGIGVNFSTRVPFLQRCVLLLYSSSRFPTRQIPEIQKQKSHFVSYTCNS